jgi:hypothetical protein
MAPCQGVTNVRRRAEIVSGAEWGFVRLFQSQGMIETTPRILMRLVQLTVNKAFKVDRLMRRRARREGIRPQRQVRQFA